MNVLLTRPWDDALQTAARLAALGHNAVLSPVIEIVQTGAGWAPGVFDAAIATSARAFQCLQLAPEWPPLEVRRLLPLYLVGAKTGEAARACGFEGPQRITLDTKALCAVIAARFEPEARVLYIAGRHRKLDLEMRCAETGLRLDLVETYAAEAAARLSDESVQLAAAGKISAVVHFSRRSAEIFLNLAAHAGLDASALVHVAISSDVAEPLAALPSVVVAAEPNEETVLALFQSAHLD